jgi:ABC-type Fe3+/spermidine/putrescine transport system ATPase subunit
MGPSGSGKSTLLHCAAGLERVDSGQVSHAEDTMAHGWGSCGWPHLRLPRACST